MAYKAIEEVKKKIEEQMIKMGYKPYIEYDLWNKYYIPGAGISPWVKDTLLTLISTQGFPTAYRLSCNDLDKIEADSLNAYSFILREKGGYSWEEIIFIL